MRSPETFDAYYVETRDWFCAEGYCPAFVGTTPAYVDGEHLTLQYAQELAPLMQAALVDVLEQARADAGEDDATPSGEKPGKKPGKKSRGTKSGTTIARTS